MYSAFELVCLLAKVLFAALRLEFVEIEREHFILKHFSFLIESNSLFCLMDKQKWLRWLQLAGVSARSRR